MPTICTHPTDFFHPDPSNPRKDFPEEELRRLGASLLKKQLVPLISRKNGQIVDGQRRWIAAKMAGIKTLDAILMEDTATEAEVKEIQLITALHRADLAPYELYLGYREWLKANPGKGGKDLAVAIDRSEALVSMTLSLSKCIKIVQEAAEAGQIGLKDWNAISQLPQDKQEQALVAKLRGASVEEIKRIGRKPSNGVRTAKIKIPLANETATGMVVVTGENIDLDDTETLLKEAMKAVRSANDKNLDCKTAQAVWRDVAKKSV